jgi:hypothetical protein
MAALCELICICTAHGSNKAFIHCANSGIAVLRYIQLALTQKSERERASRNANTAHTEAKLLCRCTSSRLRSTSSLSLGHETPLRFSSHSVALRRMHYLRAGLETEIAFIMNIILLFCEAITGRVCKQSTS